MIRKMLSLFFILSLLGPIGLLPPTVQATVNEDSSANRYLANGSTRDFTYTFKILSKQDIQVLVDTTIKTLDVDYVVAGVGSATGGTVTLQSTPASGTTITLLRNQPASQLSTYYQNEPFPSTRVERDFDRVVMQVQELKEQLDRVFKLPPSSSITDQTIDVPTAGLFARAKAGGGIDWATPTNAGALSSPVAIGDGGTGASTSTNALANLLSGNTLSTANVLANGALIPRNLGSYFGEVFNVKNYGAFGDGVTDDQVALEATLTAASASCGTVYAPSGTYAYATSPNFARTCVNVIADRDTIFKHTGTGNAFILDGGASPATGIFGNRYDGIIVQGNANSTNCIYVRAVHHSVFLHPRCKGSSTTGSGILVEWGVLNTWIHPTVSVNEGTLSPIPLYGMYLTRRAALENTTTQQIINPIMEGLTNTNGWGIVLDYAVRNFIIGGTSESNANGLQLTANSLQNAVNSLDLESNAGDDVLVLSSENSFDSLLSTGNFRMKGSAAFTNEVRSGIFDDIIIDNTGGTPFGNMLRNLTYAANGGTLTNNGTKTELDHVQNANTNVPALHTMPDTVAILRVLPTYGANVTIDVNVGSSFSIVPTDGNAFTVVNPINGAFGASPQTGSRIRIAIKNTSGAPLGTATWENKYKMSAWTQPANGFSRTIEFEFDGTNWIEQNRTPADVAN